MSNLNSDIAIKVTGVSKKYLLFDNPAERLKHSLWGRYRKTNGHEFWALKNISFEVKKGESFGVIGKNGAGKSTLLQIITGTLAQTSGEVYSCGKISALLELGSGFNPEFTGKENVYLNGSILGLSKNQMDEIYDKIIEFADIGRFINQPLKTYSSGMVVRLAFSVQAFIEPDILIIDEALSVGDIFFSQKCARVMKELSKKNTTIIFVSHDLSSVRNMCSRTLYLSQGQVVACGETAKVIQSFYAEGIPTQNSNMQPEAQKSTAAKLDPIKKPVTKENFPDIPNLIDTSTIQSDLFEINTLNFQNEKSMPATHFKIGETTFFNLAMTAKKKIDGIHFTMNIKNKIDQLVTCGGTYTEKKDSISLKENQTLLLKFKLTWNLEAGKYTFGFNFGSIFPNKNNIGYPIFEYTLPEPIYIDWNYEEDIPPFYGMAGLPFESEIQYLDAKD